MPDNDQQAGQGEARQMAWGPAVFLRGQRLAVLVVLGAAAALLIRSGIYTRFHFPDTGSLPGPTRGAVHVHLPNNNDRFLKLVEAAQQAGLDFVLFASQGTDDPVAGGREGYYTVWKAAERLGGASKPPHPILVLMGVELPTDRGNLLIVAGGDPPAYPLTRRSAMLLETARQTGGLVLALRPCQFPPVTGATPSPALPDPPATVDGVEAISLTADFTAGRYYPLAAASLTALLNPAGALASLASRPAGGEPPAATLGWRGEAAAFGGVGLTPGDGPPWVEPELPLALGWVTTHLSLEQPLGRSAATFQGDRRKVLQALAAGHGQAVVEAWGRAALSLVRDGDRVEARVHSERDTWLVLRRDGHPMVSGPGPRLQASGTGNWRAEVYCRRRDVGLPGSGWLLWMVSGRPQS